MGSRLLVIATAAALLAAAVTHAAPAPAPKLVSATVAGDRAALLFSAPLDARRGRLTVTVNGRAATPVRATRSGRRVGLVLPRAVFSDDLVRVNGLGLRTKGGAPVRAFTATAANRSATGCSLQLGSVAAGVATEGPTDLAAFLPPRRLSVLAVAVDYPDAPAYPSFAQFPLSAADTWISDLSYGRAGIEETRRAGVVRMPKLWTEYAFNGPWGPRKAFFQDLVLRLDPEIDFSRYDAVWVSTTHNFAHNDVPYHYTAIAPVGQGIAADGRELLHFGVTPESEPRIPLVAAQRWLGLPEAAVAQGWNLPGALGWHRRKLGWIDPSQVRCVRTKPIETDLTPLALSGGTKLVVVPLGSDRAVVLENRQRVGLDLVTQGCGKGVLAYEVAARPGATPVTILPSQGLSSPGNCQLVAPYDLRPGESAAISSVSVRALSQTGDGSYRLRVSP
ncbi:MAG: hypothetical protein ACRDNB_04960 [Gaiellaceae bacterium]